VPCGSSGVTCTKSVTITIYNQTLHFVKGRDMEIGANSFSTNQYFTKGLVVDNVGGEFVSVVAPDLGLVVKYDHGRRTN